MDNKLGTKISVILIVECNVVWTSACLLKIVSCVLNEWESLFTPTLVSFVWGQCADFEGSSHMICPLLF